VQIYTGSIRAHTFALEFLWPQLKGILTSCHRR